MLQHHEVEERDKEALDMIMAFEVYLLYGRE